MPRIKRTQTKKNEQKKLKIKKFLFLLTNLLKEDVQKNNLVEES